MSYFKQLRAALENEELLPEGELTPEAEAEADVAIAEAELVRQEIENNVETQERAGAVVDELEGTNEALTNIAASSPDGTIDEATAAMVEAQRRTAAAAVSLDPEEGAGADLVDQAGLESLVDGTYLSLEEAVKKNEGVIAGIKKFIAKIFKGIADLFSRLMKFISKATNILTGKSKAVYRELKALSDADFKEAAAKLNTEEFDKYGVLLVDYPDPQDQIKKFANMQKGFKANFIAAIKILKAQNDEAKLEEVLSKEYDKIVKSYSVLDGKSGEFGFIKVTYNSTPSTPLNVTVEEKEPVKFDVDKLDKSKLLNSINIGLGMGEVAKTGDYVGEGAAQASKDLQEISENPAKGKYTRAYSSICSQNSRASAAIMQDLSKTVKAYIAIGSAILKAAKKESAE